MWTGPAGGNLWRRRACAASRSREEGRLHQGFAALLNVSEKALRLRVCTGSCRGCGCDPWRVAGPKPRRSCLRVLRAPRAAGAANRQGCVSGESISVPKCVFADLPGFPAFRDRSHCGPACLKLNTSLTCSTPRISPVFRRVAVRSGWPTVVRVSQRNRCSPALSAANPGGARSPFASAQTVYITGRIHGFR